MRATQQLLVTNENEKAHLNKKGCRMFFGKTEEREKKKKRETRNNCAKTSA